MYTPRCYRKRPACGFFDFRITASIYFHIMQTNKLLCFGKPFLF